MVGDAVLAGRLSGELGGGRVLVLGDELGLRRILEQRLGRLLLQLQVEPGQRPPVVDFRGRVGLGHAEGEGVFAAEDLRDRVGGDVAEVGARVDHQTGHFVGDVAALLDGGEVVADVGRVVRGGEAGGVEEDDVGVPGGHRAGRLHEAEGGRVDYLCALLDHAFEHVGDDLLVVVGHAVLTD